MTDDKKEPTRPAPSSGHTTGSDWSRLTQKEFEDNERELRENIRHRGDF
jgi:hypothetical protein